MLLIQGWLKLAAGEFDKIADQAGAMITATAAEPGCIHYSFARDVGDPDLIHIAERWSDGEALAAHGTSDHMKTFNRAMGGVTREGADLWLYSAEQVRKLL